MSVGKSEVTPYKQNCVRSITESNILSYKDITTRNGMSNMYYHILDLTAGDMDYGRESSPKIFLEEVKNKNINNFRISLFEKESKTYQKLRKNVDSWINSIPKPKTKKTFIENTKINYCDISKYTNRFYTKTNVFGMAYFDPNGSGGEKDIKFVSYFSRVRPTIDLLINTSIWMIKRVRGRKVSKGNKYSGILLSEMIQSIDKKYWWIRIPRDEKDVWKWIMLYGTNNPEFNMPRSDFYLTTSLVGSFLLEEYDKYIMEWKN